MAKTRLLIAFLFFILFVPAVKAIVIEGKTPTTGVISNDKENAINDALKKAALRSGASIQANTSIKDGEVESDYISMRFSGSASSVRVLDEWSDGEFYFVKIEADIREASACETGGKYGKTVLFTAFQRENPGSSVVGKLSDVDEVFSPELATRLYHSNNVVISRSSYNLLPKDETSAPEAAYSPLTIIASAEKHKSQFIVSGSVIDMSMVYPEQYFNQSLPGKALASVKAGFGKLFGKEQVDHRLRNMSFRMTLYDGASGAIVFDKVYTEKGTWDAEYREAVGFGSPRFWHTGYGKAVDSLMNSAVVDLGKKLQCQPFMINAEYLPDDGSVYIPAGVDQGIKVGDSLALYFRKNLRGATHNKATSEKDVMPFSLEDIGVSLSIVQAYPSYSIAKPSAELHSGLRYVAVSW